MRKTGGVSYGLYREQVIIPSEGQMLRRSWGRVRGGVVQRKIAELFITEKYGDNPTRQRGKRKRRVLRSDCQGGKLNRPQSLTCLIGLRKSWVLRHRGGGPNRGG